MNLPDREAETSQPETLKQRPTTSEMELISARESRLDFVSGGAFHRLKERIGLVREGLSIPRRVVWAIAVTWVPLLLLSVLQGRALGPTPRESFLLDFATYGRFLLAVPLLIAAEAVVAPRLASAGNLFTRAGLVRARDAKSFERAAAEVVRWRDSRWAWVLLLFIAVVGSWALTFEKWQSTGLTWERLPAQGGARFSLAGLWFHAVGLPVLRFLYLRWLWRLVVWTRFLYSMSRLDLDLVPTHADGAGGLGFLGGAQSSLGLLACAIGFPFFGEIALRICFEGAKLATFTVPIIFYLFGCVLVFLSPPLVFAPKLVRARREGLRTYGLLVNDYNRAFHSKWIRGGAPESESFLGSADIEPLADLGTSYERIRAMKAFPYDRKEVAEILGLSLLPALPFVPIVVPIGEILNFLVKAIF